MADGYHAIRQTLENEKVDWNMPDYVGLPSRFLFSCQRLINGKYVSCFAKQEGAYVSWLTALTRVTGAKAHETHRLEAAVIQYFTFFLIKKIKLYICRVLSTLGYGFLGFPQIRQRLSTFVNASFLM